MKWIVGYTEAVGVSTTEVDYCPKGDPFFVCTKQQNKSKLPFGAPAEQCSSFICFFFFVEKNEVQLIFFIFIYIFIFLC